MSHYISRYQYNMAVCFEKYYDILKRELGDEERGRQYGGSGRQHVSRTGLMRDKLLNSINVSFTDMSNPVNLEIRPNVGKKAEMIEWIVI